SASCRSRARSPRPSSGRSFWLPRSRQREKAHQRKSPASTLDFTCVFLNSLYPGCMAEGKGVYRALAEIDREALESFQAGIRKRYSDEQILDELRASAERLGRSPTMREFAADSATTVHPQTVIEHFGSWNAAKR